MLSNKKELIKKFSGNGYKSFEPIKSFGLFVMKPFLLLFSLFLFTVAFFYKSKIDIEYFIYEFHYYWLLAMMCFILFHTIYFYVIKKKRFYAIEQSFFVLTIIYYFFVFFSQPIDFDSFLPIFWIDISILFFSIAFLLFYVNRIKKYYNNKHIWN